MVGDLLTTGYTPMGPYDAIHVGAAAPTVPEALVQQLKSPGRLIVPVDNPATVIQCVYLCLFR